MFFCTQKQDFSSCASYDPHRELSYVPKKETSVTDLQNCHFKWNFYENAAFSFKGLDWSIDIQPFQV